MRILDLETLLLPISGDNSAGEDLRYEGVYDQIAEFRKEDDPNLPQGVWESDLKIADWKNSKKLCIETLSKRSKDLQIAAWLLEALVKENGFQGIWEGLTLITKLCETFWDNIYPPLSEDDFDFRTSPFVWINNTLSEKVKSIPFTQPSDPQIEAYNFQNWEKTVYLEKLAKQSATAKKSHSSEKKFKNALFNKSCEATPKEFFSENSEAIGVSLEVLDSLGSLLDEHCGKEAPSLGKFRSTLETIQAKLSLILKNSPMDISNESEEEASLTQAKSKKNVDINYKIEAGIKSREEAYFLLSEIADYLMETDPHSPIAYLVKRAVSWGGMSLSEVLTELLKDGQNIQQIFSLLGIKE